MSDRYWISVTPKNFYDTAGWSLTTGGPGGASVPLVDNVAIFDKPGSGLCTFDSTVVVGGFRLSPTFDGTVLQNGKSLWIGPYSNASFNGGRFDASGRIQSSGTFWAGSGCLFNMFDSTVVLEDLSWFNAGFVARSGEFVLRGSDMSCVDAGPIFNALRITDQSGFPATIDGTCRVDGALYLDSGNFSDGSNTDFHVSGDIVCSPGFGTWTPANNMTIIMDGDRTQSVVCTPSAVIPSLTIDKTSSAPVYCTGPGPMFVAGDFILSDGTVSLVGVDLRVGR